MCKTNPAQQAFKTQATLPSKQHVALSVALTLALGIITALGGVVLYANVHNVGGLLGHKFFQTGTAAATAWVIVGSCATFSGIAAMAICGMLDSRACANSRFSNQLYN